MAAVFNEHLNLHRGVEAMKYFFCDSDAGQDTVFFDDELRFSHGIVWNAAKRCVVAVSYVFRKREVDEEVV